MPTLLMLLCVFSGERLTPYRDAMARSGALREAKVEGMRIAYLDVGRGPAIVLLHGLGGSLYDWRHIVEPLASKGYRVIVPDLLGSGESECPDAADYTLYAHAKRLARLLDGLGIKTATLVGNSYGGGVALAFAAEWPDRVERLALVDSVCYPERMPLYYWACRIPFVPEKFLALLPVGPITRNTLRHLFCDPRRLTREELRAYAVEGKVKGHAEALVKMTRCIIPKNLNAFYAKIKKFQRPVKIMWGEKDPIIPVELSYRLAKDFGTQAVIFPEVGHLPHMEQPEKFLVVLADLMKQ